MATSAQDPSPSDEFGQELDIDGAALIKPDDKDEEAQQRQQQEHNDDDDSSGSLRHSFSSREGESVSWTDMNMVVSFRKKRCRKEKGERQILEDVWGECNPGQTVAIMGPSGAGKTSLLNILAGRAASSKRVKIDATVFLGGKQIKTNDLKEIRKKVGFVAQEDSLHEESTPREVIRFSARLRLPREVTDSMIERMVSVYIKELGLTSCADTVIGGGLKKGISGGEKKRTSVGVELVVRPSLLLLDEPTSGLDAFSAEQVCQVLTRVAIAGTAVLFTIHQPSSELFFSFTHLILMNRGRVMANLPTKQVPEYFEEHGFPIGEHVNPADWILRVAQENDDDVLEEKGFYPKDTRTEAELTKPCQTRYKTLDEGSTGASILTQLKLLFQREERTMIRNPMPLIANVAVTAFLALLCGLFFLDVGRLDRTNPANVQAQLGAIVNVLITTLMGQSQLSLNTFPSQRPLFLREYATNHYSVFAYFCSTFAVEVFDSFCAIIVQSLLTYFLVGFTMNFGLYFAIAYTLSLTSTAVAVMLGSALTDPSQAPAFFSLLVVPQFYFSGIFLPVEYIPSFIRWAQWLCSLKYSSGLAMIYEFGDCEPGQAEQNCGDLLSRNNVSTEDAWWYWICLVGLFHVFRLGGLLILKSRATKFS